MAQNQPHKKNLLDGQVFFIGSICVSSLNRLTILSDPSGNRQFFVGAVLVAKLQYCEFI